MPKTLEDKTKGSAILTWCGVSIVTTIAILGWWKWGSQYQENVLRMRQMPLGVSRERLVSELGAPIRDYYSHDQRFEQLEFRSPPVYPIVLSAVVETSSNRAVRLLADEHSSRTLPGYEQPLQNAFKVIE